MPTILSKETLITLSVTCVVLGLLSIVASIYIWVRMKYPFSEGADDATISIARAAQAERYAIFVGLWAPSFFALGAFLRSFANG